MGKGDGPESEHGRADEHVPRDGRGHRRQRHGRGADGGRDRAGDRRDDRGGKRGGAREGRGRARRPAGGTERGEERRAEGSEVTVDRLLK
ncbi:hypothetical protein B7486_07905 [cyanobacterium TDX16]|nr:hypothetical protein B7486_07905 [cyanobacterium TDX16]